MSVLPVRVVRLGLIPWKEAVAVQLRYVKQLQEDSTAKDAILLCEHPPVYTLGKRLQEDPVQAAHLRALGAEYHKSSRGGQITFHGPGQLVGYPILHLRRFNPSIKGFVHSLEESIIRTVGHYGLVGEHSEHTGVWIGPNKIGAIGLQVSHGIVYHGFALNCNVDLTWFQRIVPCGIVGRGVTSLAAELDRQVTVDDVIPVFLEKFAEEYRCALIEEAVLPDTEALAARPAS
eukprot:m.225535 g.225535  ORF g.225535 m.225535 type:complete len:232 (+) comp11278_c0_seq1:53-748(+)